MKRLGTFTFSILACCVVARSQPVKLHLEKATVFLTGAQLQSNARVQLVKGENVIVFGNVATSVNSKSIAVNTNNGVSVLSSTYEYGDRNNMVSTPEMTRLGDSLSVNADSIGQIDDQLKVIEEQLLLLQSNRTVGAVKTATQPADVEKMVAYTGGRMESLLRKREALTAQNKRLQKMKGSLEDRLNTVQDRLSASTITVKFFSPTANTCDITLSYVVAGNYAGWEPIYDIAADSKSNTLHCFYKANIHQNTGLYWDNVKLTLSTGNPTEAMQPAAFNPWLVSIKVPAVFNLTPSYFTTSASGGRADSVEMEDVDGSKVNKVVMKEEDRIDDQASAGAFITTVNSGVNTEFNIDMPYTIPSDNEKHLIAIKKFDMPGLFSYYAAPRNDRDAFRLAKVGDWAKMDLLPGSTNIFFDGVFIGNGVLNTANTDDTLTFSLGRDKKVVILKETDRESRSVRTFGMNVKERNSYTITVRNTRTEKITIDLVDQVPVSQHSSISIEDVAVEAGTYNENDGKVAWKLTLAPNEVRKVTYHYTMKYPKGKTVIAQ